MAQCEQRTTLTVTKGLEWTPAGYRMLVKIKDLHDDFIVVHKGSTPVSRRRAVANSKPLTYRSGLTKYTGRKRDGFFKFLSEGDPDSVLMQFAVAHAPLEVWLNAWRGFGNDRDPRNNVTTVRMKIDYIRVLQPLDRYSGMEPVYE